ncbi:MAG: trypsin-like peptidase domain-containing protein [Anaerolineales bacterium]|nr:MAG: trypsin-like peptidase domain-containing protein [Anaerolineales bacterium]
MKRIFYLLLPILALWMGLLSCSLLGDAPLAAPPEIAVTVEPMVVVTPVYVPPSADIVDLEDTLVQLYEQVNPGVVALRVLTDQGGSRGSGFVIDNTGHIVTNFHVVENLTDLEVAFPSGLKVRGEVIGSDLDSDLAVLKVDVPAGALQPLPLSDSQQLKVGQAVIAIGNPFGFNGTMTMGIISGLGRTMSSLREAPTGGTFSAGDIIQTDAAINPGNSGGPLLNLNGEVIGVNRAIFTNNFDETGQPVSSGVGFAISVNIVKRVVPALIASGKYDYPYVGITSLDDLSLMDQEELNLPRPTGVYINQVTPNSPAAKAGLRGGNRSTSIPGLRAGGDLIIAVDGNVVKTFSEFLSYLIGNKSPGDTVILTILRGEEDMEVSLLLEKRP